MTTTVRFLAAACFVLCLALAGAGCSSESPNSSDRPESAAPAPSAEGETPPVETRYEAAYPEDVTDEELDETDVEQQRTTHSHGGEEHDHHDDGDHEHGSDGGGHEH